MRRPSAWAQYKITGAAKAKANQVGREVLIIPEEIQYACSHVFQLLQKVYGAEGVSRLVQRDNVLMCGACSNRMMRRRGERPKKCKVFVVGPEQRKRKSKTATVAPEPVAHP